MQTHLGRRERDGDGVVGDAAGAAPREAETLENRQGPSLPPRGPAPCSPPVSPAGRRPQCPLSSHPPQSIRAGAPGKALEEELERVEQGPGRALKFMSIPVTSDMTLLASKFFANIIITG